MVFKDGILVGQNNKPLFDSKPYIPEYMKNSVKIGDIKVKDLDLHINGERANVIGIIPDSLVTDKLVLNIDSEDQIFKYADNDILKLVVVERHKGTGNIGIGLIKGFNLRNGAIGSTIAHDTHNILVVGDNDRDILLAIKELEDIGGGITLVNEGVVLKSLPLEIGGIMTGGDIDETNNTLKEMIDISYNVLLVNPKIDPFMTLAFMALPVIPKLKLTDVGLFDVEEFKFIQI